MRRGKTEEKLDYLKDRYPPVAVYVLRFIGRYAELKQYTEHCKTFEYDINKSFSDKVPCDKILEISTTLQKVLKHAEDNDDNGGRFEEDLIEMF